MRRILDRATLKEYKDIRQHIKCPYCGKQLQPGDYVDQYFPYFWSENICKGCEKEGK